MQILIDNKSNRPIYEQIYTQLKAQIISGALTEGQALPSIRSLARDLRISVVTTKRAYDELEKEGFLYTVAAKGCFVAARNTALLREEHLNQIEECIERMVALAATCGLSQAELLEMVKFAMEA